jgi:hypothetical protein
MRLQWWVGCNFLLIFNEVCFQPETELSEVPRSVALDQAVLVNSAAGAAGAAGALAGWAISSLGKKVCRGDSDRYELHFFLLSS